MGNILNIPLLAINWNVGNNGNWNTASNWTVLNNGAQIVPNSGNMTANFILTPASTYAITLTGDTTLGYLNVSPGGSNTYQISTSNNSKINFICSNQSYINFKGSTTWSVYFNFISNTALNTTTTGSTLTLSGVLGGQGNVLIQGLGTVSFGNGVTNTYSGSTTMQGGTLQIYSDANLGFVPATPTPNKIVLDGGTLYINGIFTINSNRGVNITSNGGTFSLPGAYNNTYGGIITGTGQFTLSSNNATHTFTGANTYSGVWNIINNTTAKYNCDGTNTMNGGVASAIGQSSNSASNILVNGSVFEIGTTNNFQTLTTDRLFTINGSSATIQNSGFNRLNYTNTGAIAWGANNQNRNIIFNVTYDSVPNYSVQFAPLLQDNGSGVVSLTKNGSGSLFLLNSNTYTGINTINSGYVWVTGDTALGSVPGSPVANSITLAGGTLRAHGNVTINSNRGITLNTSTTSNLRAASNVTLTYNGIITGSGNLAIIGENTSSKIILGGTNTNNGTTTVTSAILEVAGSLASGSTVTVNGNTLQGTGTVNGTVSVSNTTNSKIRGGTGGTNTGTLNTGALTLGGTTSRLAVSCNTTAVSLVSVTGNLTITGCTVDFSGALNAGTYTIFNFTGSRSGTLTIGTLPTSRTFSAFNYNANSITVTFI